MSSTSLSSCPLPIPRTPHPCPPFPPYFYLFPTFVFLPFALLPLPWLSVKNLGPYIPSQRVSQSVRPVRICCVRMSFGLSVLMSSFSLLSRQIYTDSTNFPNSCFELHRAMPRPKSSGKARKSPEEDEGVLELHASADDIIDAPPTEEDGAAGGNRASPRTRRPRVIREWRMTTVGLVRPKGKGSATSFRASSSRNGGFTREVR